MGTIMSLKEIDKYWVDWKFLAVKELPKAFLKRRDWNARDRFRVWFPIYIYITI